MGMGNRPDEKRGGARHQSENQTADLTQTEPRGEEGKVKKKKKEAQANQIDFGFDGRAKRSQRSGNLRKEEETGEDRSQKKNLFLAG